MKTGSKVKALWQWNQVGGENRFESKGSLTMKPSRVVKTGLKVEAPWHWNQVGSENRLKVKALWHWNQVGSENRLKVKRLKALWKWKLRR